MFGNRKEVRVSEKHMEVRRMPFENDYSGEILEEGRKLNSKEDCVSLMTWCRHVSGRFWKVSIANQIVRWYCWDCD